MGRSTSRRRLFFSVSLPRINLLTHLGSSSRTEDLLFCWFLLTCDISIPHAVLLCVQVHRLVRPCRRSIKDGVLPACEKCHGVPLQHYMAMMDLQGKKRFNMDSLSSPSVTRG
ncbi:unnamed protein product [Urochloa humidicola]